MKLGIVGPPERQFTPEKRELACVVIQSAIETYGATTVVSGRCHLGGIDIWAEDIAEAMDIPTLIFPPKVLHWSLPGGYRERNLQIAEAAELVLVIGLKEYPKTYRGVKFHDCVHCGDRNPKHIRTAGCWTAWRCERRAWHIL